MSGLDGDVIAVPEAAWMSISATIFHGDRKASLFDQSVQLFTTVKWNSLLVLSPEKEVGKIAAPAVVLPWCVKDYHDDAVVVVRKVKARR